MVVHLERHELERALDDLNVTLNQARGVPYFQNGKAIGLRLYFIYKGSIYERMGLKSKDIILEVDGKPFINVLSTTLSLFSLPQGSKEKIFKINREQKIEVLKILYDK